MGDQRGNQQIESVFQNAPGDFLQIVRSRRELAAGGRITIDPALDAPIHMIQEHRVRAGPAAPDPPEDGGDHEEQEAEATDCKKQDPQILRHQGQAECMEAPHFHIEENRRLAIDRDPRDGRIDKHQQDRHPAPDRGERSCDIRWMEDVMRAIRIDRRNGNEVRAFGGFRDVGHGLRARHQLVFGLGEVFGVFPDDE